MKFWRKSTVNTQELLVHDSGQREIAERIHASIVDCLRVLVFTYHQLMASTARLTFKLEGKVIGEVATFVITTQEE
jgi:hypothetical protein